MQVTWRALVQASPRRRACDFCHHRKIRCIPIGRGCENCAHAGCQCTFSGRRRPTTTPRGFTELQAGVAVPVDLPQEIVLETGIHTTTRLNGDDNPGRLNYEEMDTALRLFKFHIDHCAIDNLTSNPSSLFSSPFQKRIMTETGVLFSFQKFAEHVKQVVGVRSQPCQSGISVDRSNLRLRLPERGLVESCLRTFSKSIFQCLFPVVHQGSFQGLVSKVYESTETQHSLSSTMCICMFTAFISRHAQPTPAAPEMESKEYVHKIFNLVPLLLLEDFSVEALQILTMLALYAFTYGEIHITELCLSWAVRMLFVLQGHRKMQHGEFSEHSHVRGLFWTCYILDKEVSMRTTRPPVIRDEDCDLDLPANYVHRLPDSLPSDDNPIRYPVLLFPSDMRLAMIKSKICQLLYSREALELPETEKLRRICILDQELDAWKSTCLAAASEISPTTDPEHIAFAIRVMLPRLEYYNCLARIHQAGRREQGILSKGLPSCDEIAMEASRSTLVYIELVSVILRVEIYWVFALSAIPAVLNIFAFLIKDPLQPHSEKDLNLIMTMSKIFTAPLSETAVDKALPLLITKTLIDDLIYLIMSCTRKRESSH